MHLKIERPLAFFDLETTGVTIGLDRIIEISILKINPDGTRDQFNSRVNPEVAIPAEITKLTGISNEDVSNAPVFSSIAPQVNSLLDSCDLAGYNSNKFDIPFLVEEFNRAGIDFIVRGRMLIDVQNIFHKMEPRTLSAAYRFYCGKELVNAHSADADTLATFEILEAQLQKYQELHEKDISYLHKFTNMHNTVDLAGRLIYNEKGGVIVNFGKHKGKLLDEVFEKEPSYYDWIMKGDFPRETKSTFKNLWDQFQKQRLLDKFGKK